MKTAKQRKGKGEQASVQRNISKSPAGGQRSRKSSGGQRRQKAVGKELLSTSLGNSPEHLGCKLNKRRDPAPSRKNSTEIKQEDQMLNSSAKIKLQLIPLDERIRKGLEKDGHNPFLELTLRARKKITSVLEHLCNKWGSSSIAMGELMLFPFNTVVDNLTTYKRWTLNDIGISAGDVHAAIGNPDVFRLRYGWVSTQPNSSTSCPTLGHTETGHMERVSCSTMEATTVTKVQTEVKSKELTPCNMNEVINMAVEQTVSSEPRLVGHMNQAEVKNEEFTANKELRMHNDLSFTSLLESGLSNISIGGLLSEASLHGIRNSQDKKIGGRFASQPTAVVSDSLDAFIDQLNSRQAPPNLSSILDAEATCDTFAFSKPSGSSTDFRSLGRSDFSQLSNQGVASRSFKCPKSEEPKTDPLPCSIGVYNNENSLGLSSIRWNDSLGPFDLPFTARQSIKDDSTSFGGFVR